MAKVKLTAAQEHQLKILDRRNEVMGTGNRTLLKLQEHGLAELLPGGFMYGTWVITPAGREWLDA